MARRDGPPRVRLCALPYAGGTAAVFKDWPAALPSGVELLTAHLPGRGDRFAEPPLATLEETAEQLCAALPPSDLPTAVLGHSMGALLGYSWKRCCPPWSPTSSPVTATIALGPPALDLPLKVYIGADDDGTDWQTTLDWRVCTAHDCEVVVLPGGHYFVETDRAAVLARIAADLA
uniref:thioesterase II family protein n=1 Tax=Streptomyces hawaiiensis TaxID=67305 RepID=UPI0031D32516